MFEAEDEDKFIRDLSKFPAEEGKLNGFVLKTPKSITGGFEPSHLTIFLSVCCTGNCFYSFKLLYE